MSGFFCYIAKVYPPYPAFGGSTEGYAKSDLVMPLKDGVFFCNFI